MLPSASPSRDKLLHNHRAEDASNPLSRPFSSATYFATFATFATLHFILRTVQVEAPDLCMLEEKWPNHFRPSHRTISSASGCVCKHLRKAVMLDFFIQGDMDAPL